MTSAPVTTAVVAFMIATIAAPKAQEIVAFEKVWSGAFGGWISDAAAPPQQVADNFVLSQNTLITAVSWIGGYADPPTPFFGGVPPGDTIRFFIWFLHDDEGEPAQRPFWPSPVNMRIEVPFVDTETVVGGIRGFEFHATLPEPVLIEQGKQMWLALVEGESPVSKFFWFTAQGAGDGFFSRGTLGDPWNDSGPTADLNFTLYGMPDADGDGVPDALDFCPDTILPEAVPTSGGLLPNRFALTGDGPGQTFASGGPGQTRERFTIFDTRGCSCDQITQLMGLGRGHRLHGCSAGVMHGFIRNLPSPAGD